MDWEEIINSSKTKSNELIKKLEEMAKSVDALKLFIAMVANLVIRPVDNTPEVAMGNVTAKLELLAYNLYPFFEGTSNTKLTPFHTNECLSILDELFVSQTWVNQGTKVKETRNVADYIAGTVKGYTEIVRGSAYPEQTTIEINEIQGEFENWFANKIGIGPKKATDVLLAISKVQEIAVENFMVKVREKAQIYGGLWDVVRKKQNSGEPLSSSDFELIRTFKNKNHTMFFGALDAINAFAPEFLPVGINDLAFINPPPTPEEWQALINLIGLTAERRGNLNNPLDVRQYPLFMSPDKKAIWADISHGQDILWEKFEEAAKQDQTFFQKYQKHKATWLDNKTVEYLSRIFPAGNIYQTLLYPDPEKPKGAQTELDAAIKWGHFLILIEVKAKQFRIESQLGDAARLRTDIKNNVENAFEQGRRASRYISETSNPEFIEKNSGRKMVIDKNGIKRIYYLTVSQHYLAGLMTQLSQLYNMNLFMDRDYPFSTSIADLDIISNFCEGPDIFLHYIERRLLIHKHQTFLQAHETDLFGSYLDCRLDPEKIFGKENERITHVWVASGQERFDEYMQYKRGYLQKPPDIKLNLPDEIREILHELRNRPDDAAKYIAFALLDLSDKYLYGLANTLKELRKMKLTPGKFRRFICQSDDTVFSIVASLDIPQPLLEQRTFEVTTIEKYRRKAVKSIGIGIMILDNTRPFDCIVWAESPWEYDAELEEKIKEDDPPIFQISGRKLPGRNDPCFCGSGKKFKKCCLSKVS